MSVPTGFPSWAYNSAGQSALIVNTLAAFNALSGPGTWSSTPFGTPSTPSGAPFDSLVAGTGSYTSTDTRLQQSLVEQRITNLLLATGFNINDDVVTILRPDVLANDSGLTT